LVIVGDEGLKDDDPLITAQGPTLREAGSVGEGGSEETVETHSRRAAIHEDIAPARDARTIESHG
jgi:hypothetical protein